MNCAEFESGLEAAGPTALVPEAASHAAACPCCAEALAAHRTLERLLPAMGRKAMPEAFFDRQKQSILQRLWQASQAPIPEEWKAPAGSLALMLGVLSAYVAAGAVGYAASFTGGPASLAPASDPLQLLDLVYLALVALALRSFRSDVAAAPAESA